MVRVNAFRRWNVQRRGQVINHCVQQRLHAFVLEGRSAHHREQLQADHALAQRGAQLIGGNGLAFQKLVQHLIVVLGDRLH